MAYAPMPQFVSIHGPKIGCNELPMATITEVLQSDPVKRLFHRPNVYVQSPVASGSKSFDLAISKRSLRERSNGAISSAKANNKPDLSVIPIMSLSGTNPKASSIEDKHLLPSKWEGKSEVALVPIKREVRSCGHYEPCENIVCDVAFQQYADEDSVSPLIAVNIDASEIDAPVSKHCKSENCDALSIDHDRCRRAIIKCHRCDKSNVCDVCLVVLKTRKSQMNHKNCRMRIEYRHNRTSRGQILRDRMRQREVQILEAARVKKNDYTDAQSEHDRAMESLHNNSELIVIPQTSLPIQQHPTIRITSVTGAPITSNAQNPNMYEQFHPQFPVVFPKQGMRLGKSMGAESTELLLPGNQTNVMGTNGPPNSSSGNGTPQNSFITVTRMPARNFIKPVNISNLLQSPLQANSPSQMQTNPFLMPIRLVQTQGIPKYCLVPDTTPQSSPLYAKTPSNMIPAQQSIRVKSEPNVHRDQRKNESKQEQILKRFKPGMRRGRRKKIGPKKGAKSFECTFCFKKFSTDWYFKLHIAKHKGEIKFTCKFCKKPFMHLYNMTKHIVTMHKKEAAEESLTEGDVTANIDENEQSLHCINCNTSFESTTEMESHPCFIICLRCNTRILDGNLMLHLKIKHTLSDEKAVEEYEWQKRQSVIAGKNRVRIKRDYQINEAQRSRISVESEEDSAERENGHTKRKKHANEGQNVRRLTRRRNNSRADEIESILPIKAVDVDEEEELFTNSGDFDEIQTSQESVTMLTSSEDAANTDVVPR